MADPSLPSNIIDELRDLRRRVERMEMAGRLTSASMEQGTLSILDAAGVERVTLGLQADGSYGITVYNANRSRVFQVGDAGQVYPRIRAVPSQTATLLPSSAAATTTSATFTELVRADVDCNAPGITSQFVGFTTGTATGEFRITVREGAVSPVAVAGPYSIGAGSGTFAAPIFTIPSSALVSGTDPVGHTLVIAAEGRVTGGAGSIYIAPIYVFSQ